MGQRHCATTLDPELTAEELSALEDWLRNAKLTGNHLEIGTAAGGTLCFLMNRYPAATRPKFAVVDTMAYFRDQYETVQRNLTQHGLDPDTIDFHIVSSSEAFATAEAAGRRFDFILVDASHKIRSVMNDLRWMRLLNPGGLACFHDYTTQFKGVRWPIDRFLRRNPHFERVGLAGTLLGIRRTAESDRTEVSGRDHLWAMLCAPILQWELSLRKRMNRCRQSR